MSMTEMLPAVLVVAIIYYGLKWFLGTNTAINPDGSIPGVTPAMVETIHSAFPDIPVKNVVYNLSKTRSAQATSEEILERGFLPSPPADFVVPPALAPADTQPVAAPPNSKPAPSKPIGKSLIDRYGLSSRVPSADKGKAKAEDTTTSSSAAAAGVEDKGKWEGSKEARERGLKERKERMILEARRRMLEKQQASVS